LNLESSKWRHKKIVDPFGKLELSKFLMQAHFSYQKYERFQPHMLMAKCTRDFKHPWSFTIKEENACDLSPRAFNAGSKGSNLDPRTFDLFFPSLLPLGSTSIDPDFHDFSLGSLKCTYGILKQDLGISFFSKATTELFTRPGDMKVRLTCMKPKA
jgi:hypothetical protein